MSRFEDVEVAVDRRSVIEFFRDRASRFDPDNPAVSMLYQDSDPDLARKRHQFEVQRILPLLREGELLRVADIGCGVGRWAAVLEPLVQEYVGTDLVPELVEIAQSTLGQPERFRFVVATGADSTASTLGHDFDLVIIAGVLHYLNDDEVTRVLENAIDLSLGGRVYCRGPFATERRLTLSGEWSEELQHEYHAVYRTLGEFYDLVRRADVHGRLSVLHEGALYPSALSNRSETHQHFWIWEVAG